MAPCWVGFVVPIVGKIGEFLMAPVGRHFGYLFSYKSKVKNLKDEVQKLDEKRGAMQQAVDEAKRNVRGIGLDVKGWLERVDKCCEEAREIEKDEVEANKGCLYGWCPNLPLRYSLGKKSTNKAKEVVARLDEGTKLKEVGYNEPLPGIEFKSTEGIKVFESRRLIMNDVMEALKDDRFHMIAICGMGGVGKTTMVKEVAKRVKEVAKRAKEEKLFDEVVMAVVSQSPNERKIQGEIGDNLGLKFEEETERGRANRLCERLRGTKRILVILDDVWKRLELNDIGIPFGDSHRGCKILLTSRFDNVCNDMNAQKKFTVEVLTEEEAWNLFQEMAGISNNTSHTSTDLYITQKKVADECGCLPIAIVTVARALKNKDEPSWNSALLQLHKSMVENIREVEDKVFKSLELSYNFLGSREIKECFLLCSLYAEDFNIPIEDLVRYGVGIEMFKAIDSVNDARDTVHAFVDDLKKGYLLMDGEREGCVKIHDVVRDVAISIVSREEHSFMVRCDKALKEWPEKERHKNYAVISLQCTSMSKLPDNLEFPKLHLLRLEDYYGYSHVSKLPNLPDSFYGGMKELKVLSMLNVYIEGSLPTSLRWLTNLRSLSLYECRLINDVSVIGALENLEILSFEGTKIEELPKEIGRLSHLKLLDLLRCGVKRICPGVLSSLSKLEGLYLGSSFDYENRIEEAKATLTELCGLSNFTTLVIHLQRFAYWPRDLVLTNLKAFDTIQPLFNKVKLITIERLIISGMYNVIEIWPRELQPKVGEMLISHYRKLLNIPSVQNLTSLTVVGCSSLRYIFSSSQAKLLVKLQKIIVAECGVLEAIVNEEPKVDDEVTTNIIMFPQLKSLKLCHLPNLKSLCPQAYTFGGSFIHKKAINCPNMRAIPSALLREVREGEFFNSAQDDLLDTEFSLSTKGMLDVTGIDEPTEIWHNQLEVGCLDKVRFMQVQCCGKLSSVVSSKLMQRLHNIQWLKVWWCDSLEMIFDLQEGVCADVAEKEILITQLRELILKYLPKLTHIWKNISQQTHCFKNLGFLIVQHCDNLRYIFTISMANVLVNLRYLTVEHCEKVEKIVTGENEEIFWKRIYIIVLTNLPSLVCFGPDVNNTEIPAEETSVRLCPKFPGNEDGFNFECARIKNEFDTDSDIGDDDN